MIDHRGFVPISMATLLPSAMLGIDVFVRSAPGLPSAKLFSSDEPINESKLREYSSAGVTSAFIDVEDRHKYQNYLQQNWHLLLEDSHRPLENRLEIMGDVVRGVIDKQLQGGNIQSLIQASNHVAETAVKLISTHEVALSQLCAVLHHDYGTFTHSANVSFYAVMLAKALGYDQDQQHEIAVGALLHDVGKMEIDAKVINKAGPLNLQEMNIMRRHPMIGLEKLSNREDVTYGQLMMTYQHHERCDATGYPCGIPQELIHPYGRLCAIVDVFEALTSQRPYRKPMEISQAVDFMASRRGTDFDTDMLDIWLDLTKTEKVDHE